MFLHLFVRKSYEAASLRRKVTSPIHITYITESDITYMFLHLFVRKSFEKKSYESNTRLLRWARFFWLKKYLPSLTRAPRGIVENIYSQRNKCDANPISRREQIVQQIWFISEFISLQIDHIFFYFSMWTSRFYKSPNYGWPCAYIYRHTSMRIFRHQIVKNTTFLPIHF